MALTKLVRRVNGGTSKEGKMILDADLVVNRSWILVARMALLRMQRKKKEV